MTRTITVVSAGLRSPSSTRMLADRLAEATTAELRSLAPADEVQVTVVEVRDHAHAIADALLTGFPNEALGAALRSVTKADAVIVVTPTFQASYAGLFKSFMDLLEDGSLRDKPVLLAATGGSERHSLMIDHALRPLFAYLHAAPVGTGVYAATGDFGGTGTSALESRIRRAAGELARAAVGTAASTPAPVASGQEDVVLDEDFGAVTPFAQLLADASR